MNYKDINIIFLDKKENDVNNIIPLISDYHKHTKIINKLSKIKIFNLNKKDFFFYHSRDCKSIKDKIFNILLIILGKNIRSPFCSLRKIFINDLLNNKSDIVLILRAFHIYKIINTHVSNHLLSSTTYCLFPLSRNYLWDIEKLKSLLFKRKNIKTKVCVLYDIIDINFIKLLHLILPSAMIIIRFHDMISKEKEINFIKKVRNLHFCKCETYSFLDHQTYNIAYRQNSVNFNTLEQLAKKLNTNKLFDIYFLGIADNKRLNFLKNLISSLCKQNIKFHIDAVVFDKNKRDIIKRQLLQIIDNYNYNSDSIIDFTPVPYTQYLQNIVQSKAIIDLYRLSPNEGLSFRTAEALAFKKKIITNRDLNANDLYKFKENILSFDDIDKVNLREFIDKTYVDPDPELLKQFDINEQIKNYLKN